MEFPKRPMRALHLFAGAGGGILADGMLGWRTVCAVEIDAYARDVLLARQRDGWLPRFPIWDDVRTFDGRPWRGAVDIVCGGFPCQDISVAGKGAGINGERSGLWREFARIIREVAPRFAFVENSPALTARGLGTVLGDLAEMGFDAEWGVLGADDVAAPHERERVWILANAHGCRRAENDLAAESGGLGLVDGGGAPLAWWGADPGDDPQSGVGRVAPRMANAVDRLRAIGNGQVPACAALAFKLLLGRNNQKRKR